MIFETAAASETARILAKLSQLEFEVASLKEENQNLKNNNNKLEKTVKTLQEDNNKVFDGTLLKKNFSFATHYSS